MTGDVPRVVAVHRDRAHRFSKTPADRIELLEGIGVEGDAHAGVTVKHRSRVAVDPDQPNLRQVHLIAEELFAEVAEAGFTVAPGGLGENITTAGLDLIALGEATRLEIGDAVIEITGLRNPCHQIESFQPGLLAQMVEKRPDGSIQRKAGIMGIVIQGGAVRPGDDIRVIPPPGQHVPLERV